MIFLLLADSRIILGGDFLEQPPMGGESQKFLPSVSNLSAGDVSYTKGQSKEKEIPFPENFNENFNEF